MITAINQFLATNAGMHIGILFLITLIIIALLLIALHIKSINDRLDKLEK